ncbi:TetR/AcrR family transcriptional regulator [Lutimaribacter marinistellae]|uniref:TetR/AcrR family transcriptional regulator n=1 Tax=Lutimaribacter marinistellae TaxID=1820329 RepID=A0ABV7TFY7_9RHOB
MSTGNEQKNRQDSKRQAGRPPTRSEDETRQLVVRAAIEEFIDHGAMRASMGGIARRAGISTRTLYRFAPSKEELFRVAVEQRIEEVIATAPEPHRPCESPEIELSRILRAYIDLLLSAEALATTRIVISELERFPDLATSFRSGGQRVAQAFDRSILEFCKRRGLDCGDPGHEARILRWTLAGIQRQRLLRVEEQLSESELDALTRQLAHRFLALTMPSR